MHGLKADFLDLFFWREQVLQWNLHIWGMDDGSSYNDAAPDADAIAVVDAVDAAATAADDDDDAAANAGGADNDDDIFSMWSGDERSGRLIADPSLPTTRATGLQNIGKVTILQQQFPKKS